MHARSKLCLCNCVCMALGLVMSHFKINPLLAALGMWVLLPTRLLCSRGARRPGFA